MERVRLDTLEARDVAPEERGASRRSRSGVSPRGPRKGLALGHVESRQIRHPSTKVKRYRKGHL